MIRTRNLSRCSRNCLGRSTGRPHNTQVNLYTCSSYGFSKSNCTPIGQSRQFHALAPQFQQAATISSQQPVTAGTATTSINTNTSTTSTSTADTNPNIKSPVDLYNKAVEGGHLRNDGWQRQILQILETLHSQLMKYTPPPIDSPLPSPSSPTSTSFLGYLFSKSSSQSAPTSDIPPIPDNAPPGLYLFGDVGCGKTMLMDLFYNSLQESHLPAKRVHFHAFMVDVHKRMHSMKERLGPSADLIVPVAKSIAEENRVLCFDEFQVTDIADAMILKRLMEALLGYGVVCVLTSNRAPSDLYKNGIQRQSFIPCIELIKERFVVQDLDSKTDYRKLPRALSKVYFHPIEQYRDEFEKIFIGLANACAISSDDEIIENRTLTVWGRPIHVPRSSAKVAWFKFTDLCKNALSAGDYLEITKTFETIFISDVPSLTLDERDQARRFILFIDAAYESKTKLFTLSNVPITQIFSDKGTSEITDHQRLLMEDLNISADEIGASSIFSGEDEVFAFARSVSRLSEMGTTMWAEASRAGNETGYAQIKDIRDS